MPDETQFDFGPVPPLVIGVSGVMRFEGEERETIRRAVKKFLWQFVDHKTFAGESVTPTHQDWRPLPSTPIAILSSLAPGADLLMVELADELEAEYQRQHPGQLAWKFKVFAPLPFPPDVYPRASTFKGPHGSPEDKEKALRRLEELAATGRAFHVPLKQDHDLCAELPAGLEPGVTQTQLYEERRHCLNGRIEADVAVKERYRLRYRAAGEYIAAHSHMLIVLNDQVFTASASPDVVTVPVASELTGEKFPYGSRTVLELKRQGITPELLRSEVAFTWADSGPVIHFYTSKAKPPDEATAPPVTPPPPVGTMTVLYPVDTRTREGVQLDTDEQWQWKAGAQFGTVLEQLEAFNSRVRANAATFSADEPRELAKMVPLPAAVTGDGASPAVREYHRGLDRLARARCRAAYLSDRLYSEEWKRFLRTLFLLTLTAALLVHVAGHWHTDAAHPMHPKPAAVHVDPEHPDAHKEQAKGGDAPEVTHGHEGPAHWTAAEWAEALVRAFLVTLAAVLLGWAYLKFLRYKRSQHEDYRFDFRALAEGVRVQVYWAAAGLAQSVPANYMQRQRNEMVWIRRAITALAAPYTRWADGFAALSEADQLAVLKSVVARWVRWDEALDPSPGTDPEKVEAAKRRAQTGYMERAGFEDHRAEQFWKRFGFDLTLSGLLHLGIWVVALFAPTMFHVNGFHSWATLVAAFFLLAFLGLWALGWRLAANNPDSAAHDHGFPRAYRWRRKKGWWGACAGGLVWARQVVYAHAYLWEKWHLDRHLTKTARPWARGAARWANALLVIVCCTLISMEVCVWLGAVSRWLWIPAGDVWWAIMYGSLLLAGALAIAWPERNAMAEHSRQYESMWAMFQAAGRRSLGHIRAAEAELNKPAAERDLAKFRGRVKAIQELLYHVGLQALDENAEWLILHRSRPLEPLMAG